MSKKYCGLPETRIDRDNSRRLYLLLRDAKYFITAKGNLTTTEDQMISVTADYHAGRPRF